MLKISRQRYDFLPHNRQGSSACFINSVKGVNELVEIGAVGEVRGAPVVPVVDGLEDEGAVAVSDDEAVAFGLLDALDDEDIVVTVAVGGDDVGDD